NASPDAKGATERKLGRSRSPKLIALREEPCFRFCQGGARLFIGPREVHAQTVERRGDELRDRPPLIVLVVGGNGVPRRPRARRHAKAFVVGGDVVVPAIALVEIALIELPVLLRLVDTLEKAFALLGLR